MAVTRNQYAPKSGKFRLCFNLKPVRPPWALPAGPRAGWRRRLVLAKTEFEPRTFDFTVQDAQVWASDVLPLDLTDTDTDGESYPLDRSVQMISAQALQRRFILVTQARPYHDVLKAQTRLEVFDPGYEEAGA